MTAFTDSLPGPGKPVCVVLGAGRGAGFAVEGPDGRPTAGRSGVRVEWFGPWSVHSSPRRWKTRFETRTGPDGRAVIAGAADEDVAYVDVVSEAFGVQGRLVPAPGRGVAEATSGCGRRRRWRGRVVADDPAMLPGWEVRAYTGVQVWDSRDPETTGFARGTTDGQGRFSFPVIAPGRLHLELKPPRELPVMADVPTSVSVVAGRKNSCEVPLRKPATIAGRIVELRDRPPGPRGGRRIRAVGGGLFTTAKTDGQGPLHLQGPARLVGISLSQPPPTHAFGPGQHSREVAVPVGVPRVEVEPIVAIPAAPPLRFIVRDENGRPAPHAAIKGSYYPDLPKEADDRGEFAVPGLAPGQFIQFEVLQGDRMTEAAGQCRGGRHRSGGDHDPARARHRPGGPGPHPGRGARSPASS